MDGGGISCVDCNVKSKRSKVFNKTLFYNSHLSHIVILLKPADEGVYILKFIILNIFHI